MPMTAPILAMPLDRPEPGEWCYACALPCAVLVTCAVEHLDCPLGVVTYRYCPECGGFPRDVLR